MDRSQTITFHNQNILLTGKLYLPADQGTFPAIVVMHSASNPLKDDPCYHHLTQLLPEHGVAVFLFDRRGSGGSGGNFETASFDDLAGDGFAAAQTLSAHPAVDPHCIGLYGISQGGWLAPLAATKHDLIRFLIIVSGSGVSPAEQMNYAARWTLKHEGYSDEEINLALRLRGMVDDYYHGKISRETIAVHLNWYKNEPWFPSAYLPAAEHLPEDVRDSKWYYEFDYDPLPVWKCVAQPTLFLFAESDRWVPVDESICRYKRAAQHIPHIRFEAVPGTNHMMENLVSADNSTDISQQYQTILVDWLKEILKP